MSASRLSQEIRDEILAAFARGEVQAHIAKRLGLKNSTVYHLRHAAERVLHTPKSAAPREPVIRNAPAPVAPIPAVRGRCGACGGRLTQIEQQATYEEHGAVLLQCLLCMREGVLA